ncbi:MAG TPA: hypothetical protein VEZ42_20715 [Pseudonocardia sp.]|nr:hypothetical protein [Pseudonocardia sp.]
MTRTGSGDEQVRALEDLGTDLARRHRATASSGSAVDAGLVQRDLAPCSVLEAGIR